MATKRANSDSRRATSAYARSTVSGFDPEDSPDDALMAWLDREQTLFRTLEQHLIADRLTEGFHNDVDGFLGFSLAVQNRRKAAQAQRLRITWRKSSGAALSGTPELLLPKTGQGLIFFFRAQLNTAT